MYILIQYYGCVLGFQGGVLHCVTPHTVIISIYNELQIKV